jgi:hypothetical protein
MVLHSEYTIYSLCKHYHEKNYFTIITISESKIVSFIFWCLILFQFMWYLFTYHYIFTVLVIKSKALPMLGECSSTELYPQLLGFWDRVSLCGPGWPWTCYLPVSASWALGLQIWATMAWLNSHCFNYWIIIKFLIICYDRLIDIVYFFLRIYRPF